MSYTLIFFWHKSLNLLIELDCGGRRLHDVKLAKSKSSKVGRPFFMQRNPYFLYVQVTKFIFVRKIKG